MKVTFKKRMSLYRAIKTLLQKFDDEGNGRFHAIVMYADGSGSIVKNCELGDRVMTFNDSKEDLKEELKARLEL